MQNLRSGRNYACGKRSNFDPLSIQRYYNINRNMYEIKSVGIDKYSWYYFARLMHHFTPLNKKFGCVLYILNSTNFKFIQFCLDRMVETFRLHFTKFSVANSLQFNNSIPEDSKHRLFAGIILLSQYLFCWSFPMEICPNVGNPKHCCFCLNWNSSLGTQN